jgi:hypothetical protein
MRYLVENYYDIQKIRVETFNRIVSFVKENREEILKELNQKLNESQEVNETHHGYASPQTIETQLKNASQKFNETPGLLASHVGNEARLNIVSQDMIEIRPNDASRSSVETPKADASQKSGETRNQAAIDLIKSDKEEKYSRFAKNFVVNKKLELPIFSKIENLIWLYNSLLNTEKELYKRLDAWSRNHPLREKFLNKVKGIGPVLASGIIAWLSEPILKADYCSDIWAYCGLAPGQERKEGKPCEYNPRLKSFCWKIGESFIKFKCFGRKLYEDFKKQTKEKHPQPIEVDGKKKWTKGHIHNWAKRKVVKLFIASVWEVWREMNGLPVTEPYPIEYMGHKHKILPEDWIEKEKGSD